MNKLNNLKHQKCSYNRKQLFFIIVYVFLLFGYVHADITKYVDSKILQVTIYPDRAVVKRTTKVFLPKGDFTIIFTSLPALIQDDTIRLEVQKGIQLGDVRIKPVYSEEEVNQKIKNIMDEIEQLQLELNSLSDEIEVINVREEFLKSIKLTVPTQISNELYLGKVNSQSVSEIYNFLNQEFTKCKTRKREIDTEQKKLKDKIDKLQKILNDIRTYKDKENKNVEIDLSVKKEDTYELNLIYHVFGVSFQPKYEIRALIEQNKIEVAYYAEVSQRTGEDWIDTQYIISTGKPSIGAQVGELQPWYLDLWYPSVRKEMAVSAVAETKQMEGGKIAEDYLLPADIPSVAVETGASVLFNVTGKHTIESTKYPKNLLLMKDSFDSEFNFITIPKKVQNAFISGKFVNKSEYPFLPGNINFYIAEDFVGKGKTELILPGEEKSIQLGVDQNIKVERKLTHFKRSQYKKYQEIEYEYKTTVENVKNKQISIDVFENFPVSRHKDIIVKNVKIEPEPVEKTNQGIVKWNVLLLPKQKSDFTISFTIEYPVNFNISGL